MQHGGAPLGEQVGDFLVGEQLTRHLSEDGQGAGLVVALDHLGVETHAALAALGTGKSGLTGAEKLFRGEQVGGYPARIGFYLGIEVGGGFLAPFYPCELGLPSARHLHVGDVHALDDRIERKSLFRGHAPRRPP